MPDTPQYISPLDADPEVLYTFSDFRHLNSLTAGQLWFAPTRTYNDIHENTIFARPTRTACDTSRLIRAGEAKMNEWLGARVARCFTTDPTNTLMWSHYASQHTGVCVGFRFENLKRASHDGQPLHHWPIRYSSTPPLSLITDPDNAEEIRLLAFDIMTTKSIHWAYEKEHRFFTVNPELARGRGGLIDVGPDAVVDVIFGEKVDKATCKEQRKKLTENVMIHAAEIDSRAMSYNLILRPLQRSSQYTK